MTTIVSLIYFYMKIEIQKVHIFSKKLKHDRTSVDDRHWFYQNIHIKSPTLFYTWEQIVMPISSFAPKTNNSLIF